MGGGPGKGFSNWLEALDSAIHKYPPFKDWDDSVNPFYVVRYPFLRPAPPPENSTERKIFDLQEEQFSSRLLEWKNRLDKELPRVMEGLQSDQQTELAAMVWSSVSEFAAYAVAGPIDKSLHRIAKEGGPKVRKLRQKIDTVIDKLEDLQDYADGLDPQYGFEEMHGAVNMCLMFLDPFKELKSIADDLQDNSEYDGTRLKIPAIFTDPTTGCMLRLYWLLRHGYAVSGDEAEVRVAMIRNQYWARWTDKVAYRPEYDGIQNKGCEAVHTAVLRFKPSTESE